MAALFRSLGFRAGVVSALILLLVLAIWYVATAPTGAAVGGAAGLTPEQIEYAKMMGKEVGTAKSGGFPTLTQMGSTVWGHLANPFYDNGPNDKGIAIQLAHSLLRVGLGFGLACLVAIPLGFVIGMSPLLRRAFDPFIQVLKPISPLAWMPLGALHHQGLVDQRHLRDLHLLGLADAGEHGVWRGLGQARMAQRGQYAGGEAAAQGLPGRSCLRQRPRS
jgi:ABC-type nitrate/sulfonate/bicarbonate transport system permease component